MRVTCSVIQPWNTTTSAALWEGVKELMTGARTLYLYIPDYVTLSDTPIRSATKTTSALSGDRKRSDATTGRRLLPEMNCSSGTALCCALMITTTMTEAIGRGIIGVTYIEKVEGGGGGLVHVIMQGLLV